MKLHFYGPKNLILNIGFSKENIMDSCYKNKEEILFILLLCENYTELVIVCRTYVRSKLSFHSRGFVGVFVGGWVGLWVTVYLGYS